jgi:hypothetical protein
LGEIGEKTSLVGKQNSTVQSGGEQREERELVPDEHIE